MVKTSVIERETEDRDPANALPPSAGPAVRGATDAPTDLARNLLDLTGGDVELVERHSLRLLS